MRYFQKGSYYHVYNRGNRKSEIFLDNRDYMRFLDKIAEYKDEHGVKILCFCLMPNHYHLLVQQTEQTPLTKFMLALATSYSKYFNKKYNEVGRLFQERFRAIEVANDEYLLHLTKYIHLNPTKLRKDAREYKWSSLPSYVSDTNDLVTDPSFVLEYFAKENPKTDYLKFIQESNVDPTGIESLLIDP